MSETTVPFAAAGARRRVLRLAHLTDFHLGGSSASLIGTARALKHVQSLSTPPEFVINGGDTIADALFASRSAVHEQWRLWRSMVRDECALPMEHCLGNHDIWLGGREDRAMAAAFGKAWAMDELCLVSRYRTFDRAGWRFIVLDSTYIAGVAAESSHGYTAQLDNEQWRWLVELLHDTPAGMPVAVVSHIPILSACAFLDGNNEINGDWTVPGAWMHIDARRIQKQFYDSGNVRVALSGHLHLFERVTYNGVTYVCGGAVCGNWWQGSYQQTPPGYTLIDLFNDGSFETEYVTY